MRVTTPSRTLIDLAEDLTAEQSYEAAIRSRTGDRPAATRRHVRAARARVEWRPSLAMLDEVMGEFCGA